MAKYYYTYVLKSIRGGNLYIGWSADLKSRLSKHKLGKVEATKSRRPLNLVYYEACLSREKAIAREKTLKSGYGRRYLKSRL